MRCCVNTYLRCMRRRYCMVMVRLKVLGMELCIYLIKWYNFYHFLILRTMSLIICEFSSYNSKDTDVFFFNDNQLW